MWWGVTWVVCHKDRVMGPPRPCNGHRASVVADTVGSEYHIGPVVMKQTYDMNQVVLCNE
jgi:hypothetical protein